MKNDLKKISLKPILMSFLILFCSCSATFVLINNSTYASLVASGAPDGNSNDNNNEQNNKKIFAPVWRNEKSLNFRQKIFRALVDGHCQYVICGDRFLSRESLWKFCLNENWGWRSLREFPARTPERLSSFRYFADNGSYASYTYNAFDFNANCYATITSGSGRTIIKYI